MTESKTVWLCPNEVAELLGRDDATIRRWCIRGLIPEARKFGQQWSIPQAAVQRILENGLPLEQ